MRSMDENKSPRRPQKRKVDSAPDGSERKKAQNRISQQCHREKNLAYVRNLENTVQLLQKAAGDTIGGSQKDRYATLLEAYLKLMEENRRLEEAMLRLRKRFLSLSNSAAAAAGTQRSFALRFVPHHAKYGRRRDI